jgi:UDP-N-acetylmuramoyl-tripeptide--D-alanyl-D-alanine ligase
MTLMTLAQAQVLVPGSRLVGDGQVAFARVHSDTRTLRPGDCFVALRGELHDGHAYLGAAREAGAVAAIAEHGHAAADLPGLEVPDALLALQALAGGWRQRIPLPMAAVTGSNGKTTVTQMTAAILRAWHGERAFATQGNLNNHIGLPLTLLRLRRDDTFAHAVGVVELGMNHPGEVALLARLAAPTVGVVVNAQREHQEFMDGVEAVARENGSVIAALPADGIVVIPADDDYTPLWRGMAGARRVIDFVLDGEAGAGRVAAVRGRATWAADRWELALDTPAGSGRTTLQMPGRHHAKNALAATAAALALGAPLQACLDGIAAFRPVKGRSALSTITLHGEPATLVDDSYNANPDSVAAAIGVLAALPGPRWLVLGDMGEVGAQGPAFHTEAGVLARTSGIEHLWCAGAASAATAAAYGSGARHHADAPALIAALPEAPRAASVLVKGSRFMRMERVVAALSGAREEAGHAA